MNYVPENENEKAKEIKKTSEADSYEDYENEAMEGDQESFGAEEISLSNFDVPSYTCPPPGGPSDLQTETDLAKSDFFEERRKQLLREKWLTVTGKKPRNIPCVKRQLMEDVDNTIYFGDRRPAEIEKQRKEKWLLAARNIKMMVPNFGRLLKEVRLPSLCDGILCIRFESKGETMATAYRNGGVQVRKPFTGELLQTLSTKEVKVKLPIRSMRYHPLNSEILYVGGGYGEVQVFNIKSPECLKKSQSVGAQINCLDITSDGSNLVMGGRKGAICMYDAETLEVTSLREFPRQDETTQSKVEDEYHKMKVYGLKCHPTDPNIFVTGSWDSTTKVWDVRVHGAIKSIRGPMVYADGVDVVESTIVTASWRAENSLSLWDLYSGKLIKNIPIHARTTVFEGEFLYSVKFFNDETNPRLSKGNCIAVGGSGFSSMLAIDTNTEKAVASLPSYKAILSLDVLGNIFAYGGKESVFRIGEVVITDVKPKKICMVPQVRAPYQRELSEYENETTIRKLNMMMSCNKQYMRGSGYALPVV